MRRDLSRGWRGGGKRKPGEFWGKQSIVGFKTYLSKSKIININIVSSTRSSLRHYTLDVLHPATIFTQPCTSAIMVIIPTITSCCKSSWSWTPLNVKPPHIESSSHTRTAWVQKILIKSNQQITITISTHPNGNHQILSFPLHVLLFPPFGRSSTHWGLNAQIGLQKSCQDEIQGRGEMWACERRRKRRMGKWGEEARGGERMERTA